MGSQTEDGSEPTLEQIVAVTAELARWESGAMGEDGWWFDTTEKLIAAVRERLGAGPVVDRPQPTEEGQ